jgi:ribonuclease R
LGRRDRKRGQRGGPPRGRRRRVPPETRAQALNPRRVLRVFAGRGRPLLAVSAVLRELGLARDAVHPLRKLLAGLEAEGRLERVGRRYRVRRRDGLVEGVFAQAEGSGDGRVLADDGVTWRVPHAGGAAPGDRVLLQPIGDPGRQRGELLGALGGRRDTWVGIFQRGGKRGSVTPYRDDADWVADIARGEVGGANDGDVVVVQPLRRPAGRERRQPAPRDAGEASPLRFAARVVEVLGPPGTPLADFRAIVWRRRLPLEFPEAVRAAADALPAAVPAEEIARRVDLRDRCFVTIDPASARDHDDALCVEAAGDDRIRLWVAIADVGAFVPAGSPIDREALRRGNSVYFPDRAIPMLPERLSGDLCSLRPDVDRLVMVVEMLVGAAGKVERRSFYPGVIRSRARLVYSDIAPVMEGTTDGGLPPELVEQLRDLARVAAALRRRRLASGSIELDLPEAEIVFGPDGRAADVVAAPRNVAHRAVEDAMLAANRAVAETLVAADQPAVHRNHEPPLPPDAEALCELFEVYGLAVSSGGRRGGAGPQAPDREVLSPGRIAAALKQVAGRPEERLVHETVLRSLTQARYGAEALGHFALAFRHYTHFTSPIRRYADLVVHRALAELVADRGDGSPRNAPTSRDRRLDRMQRVAARVSWRERVAVEAEREARELQKCAFLLGHVGEEYAASMTGAAPFGLWLTLDAHFVQGLVHVSSLPEFVDYDERRHTFTARRSGERFELGDRFDVRVEAVDIVRARIDFRILARRPR